MATTGQITEALKIIERRATPRGLVKAGVCARESEAKLILEMVTAARQIVEEISV